MAQGHAGEPLAEAEVWGQIGQVSQNGQNTHANGVAVRASKLAAQRLQINRLALQPWVWNARGKRKQSSLCLKLRYLNLGKAPNYDFVVHGSQR